MKLSRRSLFAATTTALVVPHVAWAQEKVVRYGIPMTDIPLTTGQPDRGANAYQYTGHTIYDPLIAWELDVSDRPGKMIPGLATEWKVGEADKTLWTFTLRDGLDEREHLSRYRLVAGSDTIYLADPDHAVDLVRQKGNLVIHQFIEVLQPFYVQGRQIPALLEPREHVQVDPGVRGGEPVISGTRIPYDEVAALMRDGVAAEDIGEFFPEVSPAAARDAFDFASYVDSYIQPPERAA